VAISVHPLPGAVYQPMNALRHVILDFIASGMKRTVGVCSMQAMTAWRWHNAVVRTVCPVNISAIA